MGVCTEKARTDNGGSALDHTLRFLPPALLREIAEIRLSVSDFELRLNEIRLRRGSCSSLVISGESYPLFTRLGDRDFEGLLHAFTGGELYGHRDSVSDGYISIGKGVRVGAVGHARYYEGRAIGVDRFSSFVIRMPRRESEIGEAVYREWQRLGRESLVVSGAPMSGKTTLLRSLIGRLAADGGRVVVVDERCELDPGDYPAGVDILSGYKRERGIRIAITTMSPELLVVDEVASLAEAEALVYAVLSGVTVLCALHSFSPVLRDHPYFDTLCEGFRRVVSIALSPKGMDYSFWEVE